MSEELTDAAKAGVASRRTVLRLGAIAVPAVVTLKPAYAAVTSVMTCQIPMTNWVDSQGNIKAANANGAFPPPSRAYKGEEILRNQRPNIKMTNNQNLTQQAFNAHVEYIKKMQRGTAGFTCWASIAGRRAGL
jgi:hypothetical protein